MLISAQLAAILRIAGGLDRSHNQIVQSVAVRGNSNQIELAVSAEQYPEVDLWAARRRAGPFEKEFDAELSVVWDGHRIPTPIPMSPTTAESSP